VTRPGSGLSEDAGGILRAIGSLLVALSGGDETATQRLLVTLEDQGRGGRPQSRSDSGYGPTYAPEERPGYRDPRRSEFGGPPVDQVEFILRDARERAQQILDQSTERARELIRRAERPAPVDREDATDDLRRSIHGLVTEVRDIQQRLGRIEALLTDQREAGRDAPPTRGRVIANPPPPVATFDAEPVAPHAEPLRPPSEEDAPPPDVTPPGYPDVPTPETPSRGSAPSYSAPSAPSAGGTPSPAPSPPRIPFSVVPPQRREWSEPAASTPPPPAFEPPDLETSEPPPSAVPRMREQPPEPVGAAAPAPPPAPGTWDEFDDISPAAGESGPPIATFLPGDGAITLRVTPVSGFQGLMRVQDALARLPSVRQASVEAYSQGEARLRIDLLDATDSEELAAGLGHALQVSATVRDASEGDRQLLIALR
jgi:vacuolar-type H+-ATPase subunit H